MENASTEMPDDPHSQKTHSLSYPYAVRSFLGYLEGTQKAAHTIRSYRSDLETFREFLGETALNEVELKVLERYNEFLKVKGMSTNTRRRKVLTSRKLLKYLHQRGKVTVDLGQKIPAPYKVERIPETFEMKPILTQIKALPQGTALQARNRLLFWTLAETGALVSEVTCLKFEDYLMGPQGKEAWLEIKTGKSPRQIEISPELAIAAGLASRTDPTGPGWAFRGFLKSGMLPGHISDRAVELLTQSYSPIFGVPHLTPRHFRHSAVLAWHRKGFSQKEIQTRLGLKTDYAFRVYQSLFKKLSENLENPPSAN